MQSRDQRQITLVLGCKQDLCGLQCQNVPILLLGAHVGLQLALPLHRDICLWHLQGEEREITRTKTFLFAQ